jgi:phage pi2 protein 07
MDNTERKHLNKNLPYIVKQLKYENGGYVLVANHEGGNFEESMKVYEVLKAEFPTNRFQLHGKNTQFRAEIIAGQVWSI